ncbi:MAG: CDP-alcohol phosphatidyltransferase family protein [Planctomycetia bacterium]|jgi:phosphatidylglycerophosphate synthase
MADNPKVQKHLLKKCLKPDSETIGNWMARRISRPMALQVTRIIAPLGIPADLMTCFAWATGLAAAVAFAFGQPWGWIVGAILLQLWYLLDHVDGQLARLYETESLDGAGLDYLMHHSLGIAVPLGVGFGLQHAGMEGSTTSSPWALPVAIAWALGLQLVVAVHDTRYKAFTKRLKRLKGQLIVEGGSGARPTPTAGPPLRPDRLVIWTARKLCEQHVTMNLLTVLAILALFWPAWIYQASLVYLIVMAIVAWLVAIWSIGRSVLRRDAEAEFAAWYKTPPGHTLQKIDGWWVVESDES